MVWALTAALLVAAVVPVVSLYQTPTYEASVKILVGKKSTANTRPGAVVSGLQSLALTEARAVPTMPIARAVARRLNLPRGSAGKVLEHMSAEHDPGTNLINVTYKDSDPKRAQLVANAIGQVVSQKIGEVSLGANRITATLWQPAKLPADPVSPKPLRNGLIALVATLALSAVLVGGRGFWARLFGR